MRQSRKPYYSGYFGCDVLRCASCQLERPVNNFTRRAASYHSYCKACKNTLEKERYKQKGRKSITRTDALRAKEREYRAKKRGHIRLRFKIWSATRLNPPDYSKGVRGRASAIRRNLVLNYGFKSNFKCTHRDYRALYKTWKLSGFKRDLTPVARPKWGGLQFLTLRQLRILTNRKSASHRCQHDNNGRFTSHETKARSGCFL